MSSKEQMPTMQSVVQHGIQSAVQHGGHQTTPTPTSNQTLMHLQSPSSFNNHHHHHPNCYPPLNQNVHHQQTPDFDLPHSGSLQSSNSFSSASQNYNPPSTRLYQPSANSVQHQRQHTPSTGPSPSVTHQTQNFHPSTAHMRAHYAEHQKHAAHSQTPVKAQQFNKMRFQKSYNRY